METKNKTILTRDMEKKQIKVTRSFDASPAQVWSAWTEQEKLDQWWAPKPWKAKTKSLDFREGGMWLYAMVGPDGSEQWCKVDYKKIVPGKSFSGIDAFCDESGKLSAEFPAMDWKCEFIETATGTDVHVEITFADEAGLLKILELGFAEGFTAALSNLDEMFAN